jgi:hypothetical protein
MPTTEFKKRMDERLRRWYRGEDPAPDPSLQERRTYVAGLVNKSAMFRYAAKFALPLPERYAEVAAIEELDFDALPERVVIKPNNSADNDCVMLFDNDSEIFTGDAVPIAKRCDYVKEKFANGRFIKSNTRIIAEEFVQDFDDKYIVPRDFKVYIAGSRSWVVQVVNRTGPKKEWSHRFYRQDWVPYDRFQRSNLLADVIEKPLHFEEMINLANRIGQDIKCFMRVDFYLAQRGALFGEFTSYPNAGLQFTPLGSNVLCDLMDRYPDPF